MKSLESCMSQEERGVDKYEVECDDLEEVICEKSMSSIESEESEKEEEAGPAMLSMFKNSLKNKIDDLVKK